MAPERRAPSKTGAASAGRARKPAAKAGPKARAASSEERHRLIAERAYLKAERRGFQGGDAERDWLEAEAEVDALLGPSRSKRA